MRAKIGPPRRTWRRSPAFIARLGSRQCLVPKRARRPPKRGPPAIPIAVRRRSAHQQRLLGLTLGVPSPERNLQLSLVSGSDEIVLAEVDLKAARRVPAGQPPPRQRRPRCSAGCSLRRPTRTGPSADGGPRHFRPLEAANRTGRSDRLGQDLAAVGRRDEPPAVWSVKTVAASVRMVRPPHRPAQPFA